MAGGTCQAWAMGAAADDDRPNQVGLWSNLARTLSGTGNNEETLIIDRELGGLALRERIHMLLIVWEWFGPMAVTSNRQVRKTMSTNQATEPTSPAPRDSRESNVGARRPESLRRMRALANHAMPDGDPHKLTAQWVSDLRVAANELRVLRRALHPGEGAGQGLCARLAEYALVIDAVVETGDGTVQRGD